MKVIVIYDTPWGEECEKRWLYEGLSERYECELVVPPFKLVVLARSGKMGRPKAFAWDFRLAWKATRMANRGDIIVVWETMAGRFTSILAKKGTYVISLNWLTPFRNSKSRLLSMKALSRKETWAGVNSPATKEQMRSVYELDDCSRIFWIPDVPEEGHPEFKRRPSGNRRYCFTGGCLYAFVK